jgi:hypothetical protein
MRTLVISLLLAGLVLGRPVPARAEHGPEAEAGLALGAALMTLAYFPMKAAVAVAGLAVGGVTGFLTGGNTRAAYAIWVPTASGSYVVTPENLDDSEPLEFFGSDYTDRPLAAYADESPGVAMYEALYQ